MKHERMSHRVDGVFIKPVQFTLQKVPITIFLSSKSGKRSRLTSDILGINLLGNVNKPMNFCTAPLFWKLVRLYNSSVLIFSFPFSSLPFNVYCNFFQNSCFYFIHDILQPKLDIAPFPPFQLDISIFIVIVFSLASTDIILEELHIFTAFTSDNCFESSGYKYFVLYLL